jgi:hypothetical protein
MPEASLVSGGPEKGSNKGSFGRGLSAIGKVFQVIISPFTKPLAVAGGLTKARKFRRDVIRQMSLTITNLHPKATIGGTDRRGWYTEIYLDFGDFRLRITRAIYNPGRQDLWADIASTFDLATFFRMDYVIAALTHLDKTCDVPELSQFPNTLAAIDATIWTVRTKLSQYLSAVNYAETKRMIQQVMYEEAALAQAE